MLQLTSSTTPCPIDFYKIAKATVVNSEYSWEIDWQRSATFSEFNESDFLRESAWVILCSGFRETTVRRIFDGISMCFCDWESAEEIVTKSNLCVATAQHYFGNRKKIEAILCAAEIVNEVGFKKLKSDIIANPLQAVSIIPFIGPITSQHLVKNLGLDIAKSDRHLIRIASHFGYEDPNDLCLTIADELEEKVNVVDVILWRYAAMNLNAEKHLQVQ